MAVSSQDTATSQNKQEPGLADFTDPNAVKQPGDVPEHARSTEDPTNVLFKEKIVMMRE